MQKEIGFCAALMLNLRYLIKSLSQTTTTEKIFFLMYFHRRVVLDIGKLGYVDERIFSVHSFL